MAEAKITLSVVDAATSQVKNLAREMRDLSKAAKGVGSPEADTLRRGARQLANVANNFGQAETQANRAAGAFNKANDAVRAFSRGAGLGTGMNLLGLGGVVAFAATAGMIVSQSIKLASEFQRVSERSIFSMTMNSGMLRQNLRQFQRESLSLSKIGIDGLEGARMGAAYGLTSGADPRAMVRELYPLGSWAKSYGLDTAMFAQQMGLVSQYAGTDVNKNASAIFGGAADSGAAGRRVTEFIGIATNVLQQIASGNPLAGQVSMRDALREVVGVTSMGGLYSTDSALINAALSGEQKLGTGNFSDPAKLRTMLRAGLSPMQIVQGATDPDSLAKVARQIYHDSNGSSLMAALMLQSRFGLSQEESRALLPILERRHGNILASDIKSARTRTGEYLHTDAGKLENAMAALQNSEIHLGDSILDQFLPELQTVAGDLENLAKGLDNNSGMLKTLATVMGVLAVVEAGKTGFDIFSRFRNLGGARALLGDAAADAAGGAGGLTIDSGAAVGFGTRALGMTGWGTLIAAPFIMAGQLLKTAERTGRVNAILAGGMDARRDLASHVGYALGANSSELLNYGQTHDALIQGLERASIDHRFALTAIDSSHASNDGRFGHKGGWAADLDLIDGVKVTGSLDPKVKRFILDQIANNQYLRQLGLGGAYLSDPDIRAAAAEHNVSIGADSPDHVHFGANVIPGWGTSVVETAVPGGKIVSQTSHKFVSNERSKPRQNRSRAYR